MFDLVLRFLSVGQQKPKGRFCIGAWNNEVVRRCVHVYIRGMYVRAYSYVYVCRCVSVCVSGRENEGDRAFTAQETGVASQLR